jgi:hypothetical protein
MRVNLIILIVLLFASCKKETNSPSSTTGNIYIGGIIGDSAVYWDNGKIVVLSVRSTGYYDEVNSIFVSGSDVYTAGGIEDSSVYWKNQVSVFLNQYASVTFNGPNTVLGSTSIFVSGSDVYTTVASTSLQYGGNYRSAGYIKNGIEISLQTDGVIGEMSDANTIFVNGSDVYVGGSKFNGSSSPENSTAVYWKNGVPTNLDSGIHFGFINSIIASGNHIYASGNYTDAPGYSQPSTAVYWDNGVAHVLDSVEYSRATSMAVSGQDVYVAGYTTSGDTFAERTAVYWKNGVETQLHADGSSPIVNSIYVKGSDVYVAGYEFFTTGTVAIYWKNGVETKLAGSGSTSSATSIFVN